MMKSHRNAIGEIFRASLNTVLYGKSACGIPADDRDGIILVCEACGEHDAARNENTDSWENCLERMG